MSWQLFVLLILGLASLTPQTLRAYELRIIEVEADKETSSFDLSPPSSIEEEELQSASVPLLSPLFEKVPSVVTTQNGGPGGRMSLFLRGTESRHLAFTLDGLKLNDPSNTDRQFDSSFFTSPFLKQIEIHKGPQAVLYGSDALGGHVDMLTRKGERAPETRLQAKVGSFGTAEASLSQDWKSLSHQGTLTATKFKTDGISRLNQKRFDATERDATDITQVTSSSLHEWNGSWESELLLSYLSGKNELDGATDDNSHDESENDQYLLQQKTHYAINESAAVSLRTGLNRHQRDLNTLAAGHTLYEGNLRQDEVVYQQERSQDSLMVGISSEREDFEIPDLDKKSSLNSGFVQTLYLIQDFKLQLGFRGEEHSRYGTFETGSAGVSYKVSGNTFSLQHSQGFKAPSLYQLYAPPLFGLPIGNKNLVPERNHFLEGVWELKTGGVSTLLSLFQNRLSNLITFTNQGFQNQGRFISEGIELAGSYKSPNFQVVPTFTHQNFREEESPVLRRPYNFGKLLISTFAGEKDEFYAEGRWFDSRQDLSPTGEVVKLSSFETLDLGWKHFELKDDFGIRLVNVFDREYEELFGYSVMPLSIFAHYGRKF